MERSSGGRVTMRWSLGRQIDVGGECVRAVRLDRVRRASRLTRDGRCTLRVGHTNAASCTHGHACLRTVP